MADLSDENSKRFVAVLNKKVELGRLMNALGHMTAGLVGGAETQNEFQFLQYQDADGGLHPNISHFPFIVLKADNGNKIRTLRKALLTRKIQFTDFTDTMTVGSSAEQLEYTKETAETDLEYFGLCLFAPIAEIYDLTKKFSLFN